VHTVPKYFGTDAPLERCVGTLGHPALSHNIRTRDAQTLNNWQTTNDNAFVHLLYKVRQSIAMLSGLSIEHMCAMLLYKASAVNWASGLPEASGGASYNQNRAHDGPNGRRASAAEMPGASYPVFCRVFWPSRGPCGGLGKPTYSGNIINQPGVHIKT
jgi:hypothetical protein